MMVKFQALMGTLPAEQKMLWPELKVASDLGFVLYGGTAIALRIGHRISVDFDFFSDKALNKNALYDIFPFLEKATVLQEHVNTLTVLVPVEGGQVKLSFFGVIDFGRVGEPSLTDDSVMQVASLDDLMATKVKTILQRIEVKDYRDIAAMVKQGVSLPKGLASARVLYGQHFQVSESLKALTYFEGGDLSLLSNEDRGILVKAVEGIRDLPQVELVSRVLSGDNGKVC